MNFIYTFINALKVGHGNFISKVFFFSRKTFVFTFTSILCIFIFSINRMQQYSIDFFFSRIFITLLMQMLYFSYEYDIILFLYLKEYEKVFTNFEIAFPLILNSFILHHYILYI